MELVRIYGRLTDFNGNAIVNGSIEIKKEDMQKYTYITQTDSNGYYSLDVEKGDYVAIAAVKDYVDKYLEYWGWNLTAYEDIEINIRIDKLEIYGINAFMIQRSYPNSCLMIYFRPMSLAYYKKIQESKGNSDGKTFLDIAPEFNENDIEVFVNGVPSQILELSKIKEMGIDTGQEVFGYLLQVGMDNIQFDKTYQKIHIVVNSLLTNEKGEGSLFWKVPDAFKFYSMNGNIK